MHKKLNILIKSEQKNPLPQRAHVLMIDVPQDVLSLCQQYAIMLNSASGKSPFGKGMKASALLHISKNS